MRQVLLVGSKTTYADDVSEMRDLQIFLQEILGDEVRTLLTHLDNLVFTLDQSGISVLDTANGCTFADYDAVFLRGPKMRTFSDLAHYVSRACALTNTVFFNDYSQFYPGSKVAQTFVFFKHQAPFLKTIYCSDKRLMLAAAQQAFGFPFILKDNLGSFGDSNYLVHSEEEAQEILEKEGGVDFLAQAFCPNDRDYRLLIAGDTHLVFERRGSADTHLNNTSKGGQASLSDLPQSVIVKAREISKELGLLISGVDIMPHIESGELYFLEINSQPQLRTGALLEQKKDVVRQVFMDKLS